MKFNRRPRHFGGFNLVILGANVGLTHAGLVFKDLHLGALYTISFFVHATSILTNRSLVYNIERYAQ